MKKRWKSIIAIICMFSLFLCGCGSTEEKKESYETTGTNESRGTNDSQGTNESKGTNESQEMSATAAESASGKEDALAEGELTLYCMADDVKVNQYIASFRTKYKNIKINKTTFDDSEQMDERVKTELNAGGGPDIIIFSEQNNLDVLSMAKTGAFLALDDKAANDVLLDADAYLPGTFEAGKVDGNLYILPLTFSVPFLTYDKTAALGFEPATVIGFEEYCKAIASDAERLQEDDAHATLYCWDYFKAIFDAAQVYDISREEQSITIHSEGLRLAVEEYTQFVKQVEKLNNVLTLYIKADTDMAERITFQYHTNPDVTHYVWFWENIYREAGAELGLSLVGKADGSGVSAIASSYGVVTRNAAPYAYEFLRTAMDTDANSGKQAEYAMSLKKENIAYQIDRHRYASSTYQSIQMKGLTDEMAEELTEFYNSITEVVIDNPVLRSMCKKSFNPYAYYGSSTYEECYQQFEQKLNLYVGE
ncbi:MAG: extracellular solute-binding protein [Lachnospiraceae bacterium]|nr:extracellular solute-binding protein [Lachnospiraceae bacterium]